MSADGAREHENVAVSSEQRHAPAAVASGPTSSTTPTANSRVENRNARKLRRMASGTYRQAAKPMTQAPSAVEQTEAEESEEDQVQSVLAKIGDIEEPARLFEDVVAEDTAHTSTKAERSAKERREAEWKLARQDPARDRRPQLSQKRDPWQSQKAALESKFGETGWQPRKRLSPDTLEGIRALHASDQAAYSTETLSEHFKVAPEAIRRILKSKWRPSEGEAEDRAARWERRGVKKWQEMAEIGMRPPVKWRAMGVGGAEGLHKERIPKRKKVRREDGSLSWDDVVGDLQARQEGFDESLADRLL